MPKVYTRAIVSTSDEAGPSQSSRAVLRSYYCLCGDFCLVMQGKLERLPRRRTDASYIIRSRAAPGAPARKFKLNAEAGKRVLVRREPQPSLNAETEAEAEAKSKDKDEMEMRQVFQCTRCKTPVAYQTTAPPAGSGPFLYVLRGALTELQGRVPPDAFEGEAQLQSAIKSQHNRENSKLAQK